MYSFVYITSTFATNKATELTNRDISRSEKTCSTKKSLLEGLLRLLHTYVIRNENT